MSSGVVITFDENERNAVGSGWPKLSLILAAVRLHGPLSYKCVMCSGDV